MVGRDVEKNNDRFCNTMQHVMRLPVPAGECMYLRDNGVVFHVLYPRVIEIYVLVMKEGTIGNHTITV